MIPQIFYNGLTNENRNIINAGSSQKWMDKTVKENVTFLEELASEGYMGDEPTITRVKGFLELDTINQLNVNVDALTKLVSKTQINFVKSTKVGCEFYGGSHSYTQCNVSSNDDVSYV